MFHNFVLYQYGSWWLLVQRSLRRNVRTAKSLTAKRPYDEVSVRRSFHTAKCPHDKMSLRQGVRTVKCPYDEMSYCEMSYGENSYGEKSGNRKKVIRMMSSSSWDLIFFFKCRQVLLMTNSFENLIPNMFVAKFLK